MLLRFAANDVNHCVWRDSRVILSNQKSVFTQLAKKKKKSEKTWSNSSVFQHRFERGCHSREELFATLIASPLCLCRLIKPSCDCVTNLENIIRCSGKRHFVPRSLSASPPFPCGFGAKNKEPWVKDRFLALVPFFARPTLKIPFLVVPPPLFAP